MVDKIRVLLVDDHPLLREGVARTLSRDEEFEVVGEGATAEEAIRLARELMPDLMLLDISIPGGGVQAAQAIAIACPIVKIIMLTVSEDEEDVLGALRAGAKGYVLKGVSGPELLGIVRRVHSGEPYVTPRLAANLLSEWRQPSARAIAGDALSDLTQREKQILELVAQGQSNKMVARELGLSEKTVKFYMTNILQKLQVHNRVQAALLAQRAAEKGKA